MSTPNHRAANRRGTSSGTFRVEIRPGEGGRDAEEFASELLASLRRLLSRLGQQIVVEQTGARRTHLIEIVGDAAETLATFAGVHRVQRIPKRDRAGRRHTYTATLVVLPASRPQPAALRPQDVKMDTFRGSGPGGQHRNTTDSAVRLTHLPTGLVAVSEEERSQHANRRQALAALTAAVEAQQTRRRDRQVNEARRRQHRGRSDAGRSAKTFTHNHQRGEVVGPDGRRWSVKDWEKGRWV